MQTGGQTERNDKLTVTFRSFANASKTVSKCPAASVFYATGSKILQNTVTRLRTLKVATSKKPYLERHSDQWGVKIATKALKHARMPAPVITSLATNSSMLHCSIT
jgi:hypothetical protein